MFVVLDIILWPGMCFYLLLYRSFLYILKAKSGLLSLLWITFEVRYPNLARGCLFCVRKDPYPAKASSLNFKKVVNQHSQNFNPHLGVTLHSRSNSTYNPCHSTQASTATTPEMLKILPFQPVQQETILL